MYFLNAFEKLRKVNISFVMFVSLSVCLSARYTSAPTGGIFMKFDMYFSKICRES